MTRTTIALIRILVRMVGTWISNDMHYNYNGLRLWSESLNEYVIAHLDELLEASPTIAR